jgi:hypothetical protein
VTAFGAVPELVVSAATYKLGTTGDFGAPGTTAKFKRGALLHVPAGVTITVACWVDAPPARIFQVDAGGQVVFASGSVGTVLPEWWGAIGDGNQDDGPGIQAAANSALASGIEVLFGSPAQGFYQLDTAVVVGATGSDSQGVRWRFSRSPGQGTAAQLKVTTSLGKGRAAVTFQNVSHFEVAGMYLDSLGNADIGLLLRGDAAREPSAQGHFAQCAFRNARVYDAMVGEPGFEAVLDAGTDTFTASGHPLANDDQAYFAAFDGTANPPKVAGVPQVDALFYVVNRAANTFQLSATLGGSSVDWSATGGGNWTVEKLALGDVQMPLFVGCAFGKSSAGTGPCASLGYKGAGSAAGKLVACSFEGPFAESDALEFTVTDVGANEITLTSGSLADGDLVAVWNELAVDVMPAGLTRYQQYVVRDYASGVLKLAATYGGAAVDITDAGTGTQKIMKFPRHRMGVSVHEGVLSADGCMFSGLGVDVNASGRSGGAGWAVRLEGCESKSWVFFAASTSNWPAMTMDRGSSRLAHCEHRPTVTGGAISFVWDAPDPAQLVVEGGAYERDFFLAGNTSLVEFVLPRAVGTAAYVPGIVGDTAAFTGHALGPDGPVAGEIFQVRKLSMLGNIEAESGALSLGAGGIFVNVLGQSSMVSLRGDASTATAGVQVDASQGSGDGRLELRAKAGTGATQGVSVLADVRRWSTAAGGLLLEETNPSGTDVKLDAKTGSLELTGGGSQVQLTAPAGGTGTYVRVDSGEDITIRSAAGAIELNAPLGIALDGFLSSTSWGYAERATDSAGVTSSIALVDDDTLQVTIGANEVWEFEICLGIGASAAGSHRETVVGPAGATGSIMWWCNSSFFTTLGTTLGAGGLANSAVRMNVVVHNGANAGAVKVQYAQFASDGTPTYLAAGSYMKAWRRG